MGMPWGAVLRGVTKEKRMTKWKIKKIDALTRHDMCMALAHQFAADNKGQRWEDAYEMYEEDLLYNFMFIDMSTLHEAVYLVAFVDHDCEFHTRFRYVHITSMGQGQVELTFGKEVK